MQENQANNSKLSKLEIIHNFFENPRTIIAILVQVFIFLLIFVSVGIVIIDVFYPEIYADFGKLLTNAEYFILAIFTIEYFLRVITAKRKVKWLLKPLNVVDFIAIFPNYLEFILPFIFHTTPLRILRVFRLLRFLRVMRLFRFKSVFSFKKTVIQQITPVVVFFIIFKIGIWLLEKNNLWYDFSNFDELGVLFTIIGFALGIILSQKIGVAYEKFLLVDETVVELVASLNSLRKILDSVEPNLGSKVCYNWAKCLYKLMYNEKNCINELLAANDKLYDAIKKVEDAPQELAVFFVEFTQDAYFCISKRTRCTPKAYDTLLHQSTLLYFVLMVLLLPGVVGLVSIIIANYVLYGMYYLTKDFDSLLGGDYDLIDIYTEELDQFIDTCEQSGALSESELCD